MKSLLLASGSLAVLGTLTGCAAENEALEPVSIFTTEVGDCFTTDADRTAAFLVSCDAPHVYEVSAVHPLDEGEYPGDDAVQALTEEICPDAFSSYTGGASAASADHASKAFAPTEAGWNEQGDREIICVVTSLYGSSETGSAKAVTWQGTSPEGTP